MSLGREEQALIHIEDTCHTKRLKQVYSELQMEQLIETYKRIATNTNDNGTKRIRRSLIDNFSTRSARYILKTDVLETGGWTII